MYKRIQKNIQIEIISQKNIIHLIKQKTHRNIQKFLKSFSSSIESKLSPQLAKLIQDFSNIKEYETDQNKCITIGNGCKIPVGELLKVRTNAWNEYNEYIVYSEDQARLRYIVQIDNSSNMQIEEE